MKLTGADIVVKCLLEQGVDTIFGYPGGQILHVYDALYKARHEIRHILTSHEQGASHAADGYARATGRVGVCISTSGPGATNMVTGIATAYMDSVPMVAITGQVPTTLLGKDSFQEVDITGITMPITKHNYIVKDVTKLADTIRTAFLIAQDGRPGPVLVDICKDVTAQMAEYEPVVPKVPEPAPLGVSDAELEEAIEAINSANKPVILAGGGVGKADACEELLAFAEKVQIPVTTSLMGMGAFPGKHTLFTGMIGMHGTKATNFAASGSDLFIAIGARFSDRVIGNVKMFAPEAKIMHIDIDPAEIGKNVPVHYPLAGNVKKILQRLCSRVKAREYSDWNRTVDEWKRLHPLKYTNDGVLRPSYILERMYELTKGEAIITTEVGQHQMWAAQCYAFSNPKQFISSGGLGTMGFGLGACIGAQFGRPDKKVINVAGDGSFRMNLNEMATAVEYRLPVVIALFNNRVLGMVRQWQEMFYDKRFSASNIDRATDFKALAEAFGAVGINVTRPEEVDAALMKALASADVPVLINFQIDKDDKVFPIVPPGASLTELIEE
jgi:acetolactate synthase I/II/III large subunit